MVAKAPNEITGLEVWYRASDEAYADTDPVGTVTDQSGNGRDATQATGTKQPLWIDNALGGQPVYRFDGTDDIVKTAAFGPFSQPNTVVIVGRLLALPPTATPIFDGIASTNRHYIGNLDTDLSLWAGTAFIGTADATPGVFALSAVFNGATSKLYQRAARQVVGNPGTHGLGGVTLGARHDDARWVNVEIAEVCVFSNEVSQADLSSLDEYFKSRYGFALNFSSVTDSLTGSWAYGAKASNDKIYCAPFVGTQILKIDPAVPSTSLFGTTSAPYVGAVVNGTDIYCPPEGPVTVLKIDTTDDTETEFGTGAKSYYSGAVASDGKIYCPPYEGPDTLVIDTADDSVSTVVTGNDRRAGAVVAPNGHVYLIPRSATVVTKIAIPGQTVSTFGSISGPDKAARGYLVGNKIYCTPRDATFAIIIDTSDDTVDTTSITGLPSQTRKWAGPAIEASDGKLWFLPYSHSGFLVVDPTDNSWEIKETALLGKDKWTGGVEHGGTIYMVPNQSGAVFTFEAADLVVGGTTVTPATIARSVTTPAASVAAASLVTPAATSRAFTTPTASASAGALVAPSVIPRAFTTPAASITAGALLNPAVVARLFTIPQATVSAGGAGTASPATIARLFTLPAAGVLAGSLVAPGLVNRVFVIPAVSTSGGATGTASPGVIARSFILPAAGVTAASLVSPTVVARALAVAQALVTAGSTTSPGVIALVVAIPQVIIGEPPFSPVVVAVVFGRDTATSEFGRIVLEGSFTK